MEQVVLVNCALAAQRACGWGAVGLRPRHSRCRPSGLSSQPDHNFTVRANLKTLLRVSEPPWFNLPFDFMHTDESGIVAKLGCDL